MRYWKRIATGIFLFSIYTIFWFWFFAPITTRNNILSIPSKIAHSAFSEINSVLGVQIPEPALPPSYKVFIDSRQQFFNLSCEFAAVASILFHFTNNPNFSPANEETAEKTLINKVAISKNPNVGLRMGDTANLKNIYANLDNGFGGADYYGIHAPPFFDIFDSYKLTFRPIYINDSTIVSMQKAISKGHLIMAWIKIGYAKSIDDSLSYGKVKIVRGEHAVVINGYNESGVIAMDPAIGFERHIEYQSLFDASEFFPIPFLEVYKSTDNQINEVIIGFDTPTEIDRSIPKISIENGAGNVGVANQMRDILKDFGYNVIGIANAGNFDYQDITIQTKKDFSDFVYILKRDLKIASFVVASSSASLLDDDPRDVAIIVGK